MRIVRRVTDARGAPLDDESAGPGLRAGRHPTWTPRLPEHRLPEARAIRVEGAAASEFEYRFEAKLYPAHRHSDTSLWPALSGQPRRQFTETQFQLGVSLTLFDSES